MTMLTRLFANHRRREAEEGQALVLMIMILGVVLMFATLLIDGSMMLEARRDLEVIASHAANAGAQRIDQPAMQAKCQVWLATIPAGPQRDTSAAECSRRFVFVNTGSATAKAAQVAADWMAEANRQNLSLPGFTPRDADGAVRIRVFQFDSLVSRSSEIEVTARRCYQPFLFNIFLGAAGACPNGTLIQSSATARTIAGN